MQTTVSNTNFKGAFRIKPCEAKAQKEIPTLFTQGRQIFSDILEKGDQFVVIRDNYDKRIGNYIKENAIKNIEYYPQINTKCGLDSEKPQELIELIKGNTTEVLFNIEDILAKIFDTKKIKHKKTITLDEDITNITNALRLNIENPKITVNKNSTTIRDEEKKRSIEFVKTLANRYFVYVKPDSISESTTRCLLDKRGNIIKFYDTPDDIYSFLKRFSNLKKKES